MSLWGLFGGSNAREAEPEGPRELVNLTGEPLHRCVANDNGQLEVAETIQSSGPVPTVRKMLSEPDHLVSIATGSNEWQLPVYDSGNPHWHTTIINLRPDSGASIFIVPDEVLDAAARQPQLADRRDLCSVIPVSYKKVAGGIKGQVYWVGVRVKGTGRKWEAYDDDDDDDDDD